MGVTARTVLYRPLNERQTSIKAGESFAGRALARLGEGCKVERPKIPLLWERVAQTSGLAR
jgi:hypothetical protein